MPCDGKNANCDRRRELLAQLKCLVSSMDRKKPCEWDEPDCPPPTCCPVCPNNSPPCCSPVKACKSFELRGSLMYRCECIKRNGLQDRCMMWDCMGRPECMTKLYPVCGPGRSALLKLTDLGDAEVALRKFYCADQARESALAAYCRLKCGSAGCAGPNCDQQENDDPCCPRPQPQCCPPPPSCCPPPPSCCPPPPSCCPPPPSCCPPPPSCCPPPPSCCPPPPSCCPQPQLRAVPCGQPPCCPQLRIQPAPCPPPPCCPIASAPGCCPPCIISCCPPPRMMQTCCPPPPCPSPVRAVCPAC